MRITTSFRLLCFAGAAALSLATSCGNDDVDDAGTADVAGDTAGDSGGADTTDDAGADVVEAEPILVPNGDGDLELTIDGEVKYALPAGIGARILNYVETSTESVAGIWEFTRRNETEVATTWSEATVVDGVTTVAMTGTGVSGTLSAWADDRTNATRFRFEWEGEGESAAIPFRCDDDASFLGWGEQYNRTDQRGAALEIFLQEQGLGRTGGPLRGITGDEYTTYFPQPYWVDIRGFGVLFETNYRTLVDLCATDEDVAWIEETSGGPVEWVVFHGPEMPDVITQLGDVVGRPIQPPDWAFGGPWISIQGGQDVVTDEVARIQELEIPIAAVWSQDWTGLRLNFDGGFGVEYRWAIGDDLYPDLATMVSDLHDDGIRFLGYANPFVDAELDDFFPDMDEQGLLIKEESGESLIFAAPNGQSSLPDFTNDATREFVRNALIAMVEDYGMDGWMSDFGEALPFDSVLSDGSDAEAYHNVFPVDWHRTVREALDTVRPDGDYVTIARSGWTGVQRYAMIHWAGDQEVSWSETDGLPTVLPALINMGLSGQPFVTFDVGGFFGSASDFELYIRWTEMGAFAPIMRTHETNRRNENWNWHGPHGEEDEETISHFRRLSRVHVALQPELVALAEEAATTGMPMVRHLALHYPDDPAVRDLFDQYLLGPDLLVAPIQEEGATSRDVYLPEGAWFHIWSGDEYQGGQTVSVDSEIGYPPVFSRGADRDDLRSIE